MLSGVSTICFAASYTVALALEISRLLFRSGVRGAIMIGFAAAGLVAHTAFLYYLVVREHRGSTLQRTRLVSGGGLGADSGLPVLRLIPPQGPLRPVLAASALGFIGTATFLADRTPLSREPASKVWGAIHGLSIMLATVSVLLWFCGRTNVFQPGPASSTSVHRPSALGCRAWNGSSRLTAGRSSPRYCCWALACFRA